MMPLTTSETALWLKIPAAAALFIAPLGLWRRARFAVAITESLLFAFCWCIVRLDAEILLQFEAALVWCACLVAMVVSSKSNYDLIKEFEPSELKLSRVIGLRQAWILHLTWMIGIIFALWSTDVRFCATYLMLWSFAFIWLAQTTFWSILISYEWIGHSERREIFKNK